MLGVQALSVQVLGVKGWASELLGVQVARRPGAGRAAYWTSQALGVLWTSQVLGVLGVGRVACWASRRWACLILVVLGIGRPKL